MVACTFSDFLLLDVWDCADAIFVYRTPQFFKVESQLTDDGVLASDHRPVIADIEV